ncbi:MAG: DNA polymerase I [Snowella sp.]|jgi:DNA polymerase-1|nr:MAG: DNA polymerase I [Snowella sp.]
MSNSAPLLILIDGHSLAFRAYYAFALSRKGPLRTVSGIPTSVCFGFLNSLVQVIESQKPQAIAIAFDRREPTFRHQADVNYKADREETPEDFIVDLRNLRELLAALNLETITYAGYEADDILGTLAHQASQANYQVKIVSGDRDLFQLVDPDKNISVLYLERNPFQAKGNEGYSEFNEEAVKAKMGVTPAQIVDYKALCGDKSDNIPGVRGIGEKTAVKLLNEYGTLEAIYENLSKIKGAIKTKLETGKADAEHSRHLAEIVTNVPLDNSLETFQLTGFDRAALKSVLEKLELRTFLEKLNQLQGQFGGEIITPPPSVITPIESSDPQQLSLFKTAETPIKIEPNPSYHQPQTLIQPEIIDTLEKLNNLVQKLQTYTNPEFPVAWDTETTGLDPFSSDLVGIGCAWGKEITEIAYFPVGHTDGQQLEKSTVLEALKPILESDRYPKVFQNTKFDRLIFKHQGINLQGVVLDTMLASYVLHPEQNHNLTDLCRRYLPNIVALSYKDLGIPKGKNISQVSIEIVANYCGLDAYSTLLLVPKLRAELSDLPELEKLLLTIEQPLEPILAAMEDRGIRIDVNYLQELSQQLEQDLHRIETEAYVLAGEQFNLGSPKQLGEILFEKLGLNLKKSRKTKTGYSTDHATLEKLQGDHPLIDEILNHRTLSKLKSTYVDALPMLVNPKTQRVHTDFNQTVTTTGRLSSSNPNLQNIPIRTEFSRKIRQAFIPKENWILVSADYSQIELRILAHLSQEPVLLEAYRNHQDVHEVTARLLFDKEIITPAERNLGKTINFGVIYGMGAQRFAREAGVSSEEGRKFIDRYRQKYAQVFNYLETMKKCAIADGFVTTIEGRRRYFEFGSQSLRKLRGVDPHSLDLEAIDFNYTDGQLLRSAANAPIQGSSADLIKIAMVKIDKILANYEAKLLLQVHDELIFEMPTEEWEILETQIKRTMEEAVSLSIPLVVEIHAGKNWMEAK